MSVGFILKVRVRWDVTRAECGDWLCERQCDHNEDKEQEGSLTHRAMLMGLRIPSLI